MTATTATTTIRTASRTYVWKTNTPRLGPPSERLYVNNICIGWARPALGMKGFKQHYDWACLLPGMKADVSSGIMCDTLETAQAACLKIAKRWFELADSREDRQ